ncbi:MAG: hypothetical protein NDJ94_19460 [Vicinamibacteria bacterium]|nr:hypothetical protein [Vicinamibacteria bacterium]
MSFEKARDWSLGEVSGAVFVPPGEKLDTAPRQVGLLASRKLVTGIDLHDWVMKQYRAAAFDHWHEEETADEACKVGGPTGPTIRPFVALHVCRGGAGVAACAEVDDGLTDAVVARCAGGTPGCWDELCRQMWETHRAGLETLVRQVATSE